MPRCANPGSARLRSFRWSRLLRLEDRLTPALTTSFDGVSGLLTVTSDAADSIVLATDPQEIVTLNGSPIMSGGQPLPAIGVKKISAAGGPGGNVIDMSAVIGTHYNIFKFQPNKIEINIVISGGLGDDTITGSQYVDRIDGGGGKDSMSGGAGDDFLLAELGDTLVDGGSGFDETLVAVAPGVGSALTVEFDPLANALTLTATGGSALLTSTDRVLVEGKGQKLDLYAKLAPGAGSGEVSASRVWDQKRRFGIDFLYPIDRFVTIVGVGFDNIDAQGLGIAGGAGDDAFTIDPQNFPITIDGGQGADNLTINSFGLSTTQNGNDYRVQDHALVTVSNVESTTPTKVLYGDNALDSLEAQGVSIGVTEIAIAGGRRTYSVTVECLGTIGLSDVQVSLTGLPGGVLQNPDGGVVTISDNGGNNINWDFGSLSVSDSKNKKITLECKSGDIDIVCEVNAKGYSRIVIPVVPANQPTAGPPTPRLVSIKTTGTASTLAGSTVVGLDESGHLPISLSSASDLDPSITTFTAGQHLYVAGNVMVDVAPDGKTSGNGQVGRAIISSDGRYVVFDSTSTNLVTGVTDANGVSDVFVRDLWSGVTSLVSVSTDASMGIKTANAASFIANGSPAFITTDPYVMHMFFDSLATDVVTGLTDTNGTNDLFAYSMPSGVTTPISLNALSAAGGVGGTATVASSLDGRYVAFTSPNSLVGGLDTNGVNDVYLRDTKLGITRLLSLGVAGVGNGASFDPVFSPDGTKVVFTTLATNLSLLPDTNGGNDLYVYDITKSSLSPLSTNHDKTAMGNAPTPSAGTTLAFADSANILAFFSDASNLISGPPLSTNHTLFTTDVSTGAVERITDPDFIGTGSPDIWYRRAEGIYTLDHPRMVAFSATHPTTGGQTQLWLFNSSDKSIRLVSHAPGSPTTGVGVTGDAFMSADGATIVYSTAGQLSSGDTNAFSDVYATQEHSTLYFATPSGNGADAITLQVVGSNYIIADTATTIVLAMSPVATTRFVNIQGADNEADVFTILLDATSVFNPPGASISVHGGVGPGDEIEDETDYAGASVTHEMGHNFSMQHDSSGNQCGEMESYRVRAEVAIEKFQIRQQYLVVDPPRHIGISPSGTGIKIAPAPGFTGMTVILELAPDATVIFEGSSQDESITLDASLNNLPPGVTFSIAGGRGNDVLDASKITRPVTLDGGTGNDKLMAQRGTLNPGAGSDTTPIGTFTSNTTRYIELAVINDPGRVHLSSSGSGGPVTVDLDSTSSQTINAVGDQLYLSQPVTDFAGGSYGDTVVARALASTSRFLDGGSQVADLPIGDRLLVDAQGAGASVIGNQVRVTGKAPIDFINFEQVVIQNNLPGIQLSYTQVNDGADQRSMVQSVTLGFTGLLTFVTNAQAAVEVRDKFGTLVPVNVTAADSFGYSSLHITPVTSQGGSFFDGKYTVTVLSAQITGGLTGGDATFTFHRQFGDITGDEFTDNVDFVQYRLAHGSDTNAANYNPALDFNGDGFIDNVDFIAFRQRIGMSP